jgi:hypothetical protein
MQTLKLAVSSLLLSAVFSCSAPPEDEVATSTPSNQFNTTLDMKEVMALVLEPAADTLWDSGGWVLDSSGYEELYPTTDEGWDFVRAQAAVIVETGNVLALPGRAVDDDAWMIYSQGLSEAGVMAMTAAASQNEEDFFQAGAKLYSVCTACHQAYNPDILNKFAE